ncbi:MAG: hypothetical protein ABIW76_02315 [Fibrobacteria bacterium]
MTRLIAALTLAGALTQGFAAPTETEPRWQFAGENQGIRFFYKVANECRNSGAKVEMKLESTLEYPVTVSFRLVDPEWKRKFERELSARMKDTGIKFIPEEGTACHPYIDEVFVETRETQVTHSGVEAPERVQDPVIPVEP